MVRITTVFLSLCAAWYVAIGFMGCATLAKPETFEQKLAYAYGSVTAVRQTATDLLKRDRITVEQARYVQEKADEARGYLDLARTSDPAEAQDKLQTAITILTALEASLKQNE